MPALAAPMGVAVACVWMIFVKISVRVPQATMIPTMFGSAIKTLIMSALMASIDTSMYLLVLRMIACVTVGVSVRIVGECRCSNSDQRQCCSCY